MRLCVNVSASVDQLDLGSRHDQRTHLDGMDDQPSAIIRLDLHHVALAVDELGAQGAANVNKCVLLNLTRQVGEGDGSRTARSLSDFPAFPISLSTWTIASSK